MSVTLGGKKNDAELKLVLPTIEALNREDIPAQWNSHSRGGQRHHLSPGRNDLNAGDYVFYNPCKGVGFTPLEVKEGRVAPSEDAATMAITQLTPGPSTGPISAIMAP